LLLFFYLYKFPTLNTKNIEREFFHEGSWMEISWQNIQDSCSTLYSSWNWILTKNIVYPVQCVPI